MSTLKKHSEKKYTWRWGVTWNAAFIPLTGVMGMGLFVTPSYSKWASFYVVGFLDSVEEE